MQGCSNIRWTLETRLYSFLADRSHILRSLKVLCSYPKLSHICHLLSKLVFDVNLFFFFRLTKCTFHKYGHSGTIEKHDALCLLALNIISEKIYVFVWFWLIILAVLTAGYMIYTIAVIAIPTLRKTMLQVCHKFFICCSQSASKVILKCSQNTPEVLPNILKVP